MPVSGSNSPARSPSPNALAPPAIHHNPHPSNLLHPHSSGTHVPRRVSIGGVTTMSDTGDEEEMSGGHSRSSYRTESIRTNGYAGSKKASVAGSIHPRMPAYADPEIHRSWVLLFCSQCYNVGDSEGGGGGGGGGETETDEGPRKGWPCPWPGPLFEHRLCPKFQRVARLFSLLLVIILSWGVVYLMLGEPAAPPNGQLFSLALLCITAKLGGWLVSLVHMPSLLGMLLVGVIFQNIGLVHITGTYVGIVSNLRQVALVLILTRAGLDLDPAALKRLYATVLRLGLVPWTVECTIIALMTHFLLGLPWIWGFLLGSIVAAVSPAVVVPCLIRLREKGYGVAKGIPTLIIAVSGIDDAFSVAVFGVIQSMMFSSDALAYEILMGPLAIILGVGFGIVWGLLSKYVPDRGDPFVVPLRVLMLFGGGLVAVIGSEEIGFGGAGPLGCITAAFVSCVCWTSQGWDIEDNPVATAFEVFWIIFEPILFGLTGTEIKLDELEPRLVSIGLSILIVGVVIRILCTIIISIGCKLNLKEKIFVSLSWMAKATVQAALGPVVLGLLTGKSEEGGIKHNTAITDGNPVDDDGLNPAKDEIEWAKIVLVISVLSIMLTAPIGAIAISLSGPRLLKKASRRQSSFHGGVVLTPMGAWNPRPRPSLRDISLYEGEEDEDEDEEMEDVKEEDAEEGQVKTEKSEILETTRPGILKDDWRANLKGIDGPMLTVGGLDDEECEKKPIEEKEKIEEKKEEKVEEKEKKEEKETIEEKKEEKQEVQGNGEAR
ncbi:sodium/hydrogen exchanger 9B2-like isoform X2 [Ischnura elegans]|uniref:sodium/hydrogen exchanger 9B2-like isoform X2 n=1 Tax=Ischnura elegans TaxID=197161 RepID=UPI001ED8953C|nr:sodium/hydrogen exchanger 9B2-like isoform X2 [Ischnura elegans]